jgi:hypothetical protein
MLCDSGDLSVAADKVYFDKSAAQIVIFGHTHAYTMKKHYSDATEDADKGPIDRPCRAIYANTGAWTDPTHFCTYVETEEDAANKRHDVRIIEYPGKTVLYEGFVELE